MSEQTQTPQKDPSTPKSRNHLVVKAAAAAAAGTLLLPACAEKPAPPKTEFATFQEASAKLKEVGTKYGSYAYLNKTENREVIGAVEGALSSFSTEVTTRVDAMVSANSTGASGVKVGNSELIIYHSDGGKDHNSLDSVRIKSKGMNVETDSEVTVIHDKHDNVTIHYLSTSDGTGHHISSLTLSDGKFESGSTQDDDGNYETQADHFGGTTTYEHGSFAYDYTGSGANQISLDMQQVTRFLDQANTLAAGAPRVN